MQGHRSEAGVEFRPYGDDVVSDEPQFVLFLLEVEEQQRKPDDQGCGSHDDSQGHQSQVLLAGKTSTITTSLWIIDAERWANRKDECEPAVCFGARQGEVEQGQAGEGGLHAVGQGAGAAVPGEPGAQLAEELHTKTRRNRECKQPLWVNLPSQLFLPLPLPQVTGKPLTVHLATSRFSKLWMKKKNFTSAKAARSAWATRGSHTWRSNQSSMRTPAGRAPAETCSDRQTYQEADRVVVTDV